MDQKKVIIIGGGVAGLSAGIYAQLNGFNATILEMHDKPGGQLTAWERNGYHFDYCLHWLVGTDHGVFNDIWKETGAMDDHVQVINHLTFSRVEDEEHGEFIIYNSINRWKAYLLEGAPEDEKAINELCEMIEKSTKMEQFEDAPGMRSAGDYMSSLWHMGSFLPIILRYGKRTARELFEDLGFKNERLLYFFNQLFGAEDFSALGLLMTLGWGMTGNAGYLKGGSLHMAMRMARRFRQLGGEFQFQSRVNEIIVENDTAVGVKLAHGDVMYADHIISACDGHAVLFDMLKGTYLNEKFEEAYAEWPLFKPLVMIGFGIDKEIQSPTHNTSYTLREPMIIGRTSTKAYSIFNRSMYDEAFAPKGKTTLLMQFETPWEVWESLKGLDYHDEKEAIRKVAIELLEKHYPGACDHIETMDIATPHTTIRYTGVWKAAYEGFRPTTNVLNGLPMKLEGLENFTMIGQWLFPGGGLPPSAQSGKWAIQRLVDAEGGEFMTHEPETAHA